MDGRCYADDRSAVYRFARSEPVVETCRRHGLAYRPVVRTAIATCLVVGTILNAINQGDALLSGDLRSAMLWQIPLTYSVPYMVATFSALRVARIQR